MPTTTVSADTSVACDILSDGIRKRLVQHVDKCKSKRDAIHQLRKKLPTMLVRGYGTRKLLNCSELSVTWDHSLPTPRVKK
eukprot:2209141-Amphidinium_carterae.2